MKVDLKLKGMDKFVSKMKTAAGSMQRMRATNLAAATVYRQWISKNFRADGGLHDDGSLKWERLKESTVKSRRKGKKTKKFPAAKILRDTGSLMRDWELTATEKYGKVKSKRFYSSIHEHGSKKRNIPKRKIFPTDKQSRDIVKPVYEKKVQAALGVDK